MDASSRPGGPPRRRWPVLQTVNGAWGATYPYPNVPRPPRAVQSMIGTDTFTGPALGPRWEWNHNPDTGRFSVQGPTSTATIVLNYSAMSNGDRAGPALLRDQSAWIGMKRDSGGTRVVMTNGLTMDSNWNTTGTGAETASASIAGGRIQGYCVVG